MDGVLGLATMLCVRDLPRSVAFYRDVLGFEVLEERGRIAFVELAGQRIYLFIESPPTEDKPTVFLVPQERRDRGNVIVVFRVEDCDAAYADLLGRGAEFLTPSGTPPWGGRRCFFQDPDGYVLELEQEP
jgi:glyoxylase I family protein